MIRLVDQLTVREVGSWGGLPQISKQLHPAPATSHCEQTETRTSWDPISTDKVHGFRLVVRVAWVAFCCNDHAVAIQSDCSDRD